MTVATTTNKEIATGNGLTTTFPFTFGTLPTGDLVVTLYDLNGLADVQVENTDYTVLGEGSEDGGAIVFVTAPPANYTVLIQRIIPTTQPTDFKNQGSFYPRTHERAFDRAVMIDQQQDERITAAMTLPPQVSGVSTVLPSPTPNTIFGWNAAGDAITNFPLADIATGITYGNKTYQTFVGNGAQVNFTLAQDPGSLGNLDVSIDGVTQVPGADYTYSGTTLTMTTAPANGAVMLVRFDTAVPNGVTTSNAVNFNDLTAPAYLKTVSDILNGVPVNVRRFFTSQSVFTSMLDGSVTFDATTALQAALVAYGENQSRRGGRLDLGRGRFIVNDTLRPSSYATDNAINLEIVGEGWLATWLDFSAMTGTKDGIVVANDQQIKLAGFFMKGGAGTRDGIHFGRNLADGGANANAVSIFDMQDIRVQAFGRDGFHHYNSYMGTMARLYAIANGRDGFRMDGYHTSLALLNCYARANTAGAGFRINGMTYSKFMGCASDVNALGFVGSNMRATSFSGCGAEGNDQDGWFLFADNTGAPTSNPLFVSECYDVRGVTLENCSGYGNNIGNAGYAGLLRTSATGTHSGAGTYGDSSPHKVIVEVRNSDANVAVAGTKAIVTALASGGQTEVTVDGDCFMPGGFTKGAGTRIRNKSLRGKKCKLTLSADATISNSTATDVTWSAAADDIGGCWAGGSPTLLTVPAGVSRIRLTASTGWVNNVTGSRRFIVTTGGGTQTNGYPRDDRAAAGNFNSTAMGASDVFDVTPGDQFKMQVEQSSGGNLDLRSNTTFLTLEVIE